MQVINNLSFIESAAHELLAPKPCTYSTHQIYLEISKHKDLKCQTLQICGSCPENNGEKFNSYFVHNKNGGEGLPCIVYLHGLSSYCFQAQHLLSYLSGAYNLCMYDMRGHGKNKNECVSYGIKQSADLYDTIIGLMKEKGVKEIYLWGRSMGASTILNLLANIGVESEARDVMKSVVLDSPFSSFEEIGKETIGKNLGVPAFICSPLINMAIAKIHQKYGLDLHTLQFTQLGHIKLPAVFIYSSQDEVVHCGHTEKIMKGYGGRQYKLKGEFSHNEPRPGEIVREALYMMALWKGDGDGRRGRRISEIGKGGVGRKGLSISLISYKNIQEKQAEKLKNCQSNKQNKTPPKNPNNPRASPSPSPVALGHTPSQKQLKKHKNPTSNNSINSPITKQSCISQTIQKQLLRSNKNVGVGVSQKGIDEKEKEREREKDRSKSRHKLKIKQPFLTNRIYM